MANQPMGMGKLGSDNIIFKRKFRWTMALRWRDVPVDEYFVKVAARPSLTIEEQPINFLHGRMYLPGKAEWDTMTITYYDIGTSGQGGSGLTSSMETLYSWLASVYNFTDPVKLEQSSSAAGYGALGRLTLYDGCGAAMEQWIMKKMFPTAVNFGDLAYDSNEEVTIELTVRFSEVEYKNLCPGFRITPACVGCDFAGDATDYTALGQNFTA